MTSNNSLKALQLNVEKTAVRIDKAAEELTAVRQSGAADKVSYLQATALELREQANELRKEENSMLQAPNQHCLPVSFRSCWTCAVSNLCCVTLTSNMPSSV